MVNIHLNGDIVRCPNTAERIKENRKYLDGKGFCVHRTRESYCNVFQNWLMSWETGENSFREPRCHLSKCDICPGHKRQTETGKQDKEFNINSAVYRKLASSAHYLVKESKVKTLFITLTFPKFKYQPKKECKNDFCKATFERQINESFSKFAENIRSKNYGCEGYIAVREFGSIGGRVHFHMLCAIPFTPFDRINAAWCSAISDIAVYSRNAVTTDKKARFVRNPVRAMRYCCKYFSKCRGSRSKTRLVFISNNVLQRPKQMDAPIESVLDSFHFDYMKQTSDFTTCYRITDDKQFNDFCNKFLYPFFELSYKKSNYLYSYPVNSS